MRTGRESPNAASGKRLVAALPRIGSHDLDGAKLKDKKTPKTSKSAYKALASIPNGFIGKADKQSTVMRL